MPRQTSQTLVLGGAPRYVVGQEQNIFERVASWAWTSRPITASQRESVTGHLVRTRHPQRRGLLPLRRQDLEANGSASFAPSGNATTGEVALTIASQWRNACSKSSAISVRTFCAFR